MTIKTKLINGAAVLTFAVTIGGYAVAASATATNTDYPLVPASAWEPCNELANFSLAVARSRDQGYTITEILDQVTLNYDRGVVDATVANQLYTEVRGVFQKPHLTPDRESRLSFYVCVATWEDE